MEPLQVSCNSHIILTYRPTFKLKALFLWMFRFMSKRRLLVISAPSEDDYSFQQQHSALSGQECHLGQEHAKHTSAKQ